VSKKYKKEEIQQLTTGSIIESTKWKSKAKQDEHRSIEWWSISSCLMKERTVKFHAMSEK